MVQKTYAISHLVDWKAEIGAGKAKLVVHFTGGAMTAYGTTPAEYTTSEPLFQHMIERSDYFKSGRIKLARVVEMPDPVVAPRPAVAAEAAPSAAAEAEASAAVVIDATCREDVVEYLKEKFGYTAYELRGKAPLKAALEKHGIVVEGWEVQ